MVGASHSASSSSTPRCGFGPSTWSSFFTAIGLATTATGSLSVLAVADTVLNVGEIHSVGVVSGAVGVVSSVMTSMVSSVGGRSWSAFTSAGSVAGHSAVSFSGTASPAFAVEVFRPVSFSPMVLAPYSFLTPPTPFAVTVFVTEYPGDTTVASVAVKKDHSRDFGAYCIPSGDGSVIISVVPPGGLFNIIHLEAIGVAVSICIPNVGTTIRVVTTVTSSVPAGKPGVPS